MLFQNVQCGYAQGGKIRHPEQVRISCPIKKVLPHLPMICDVKTT